MIQNCFMFDKVNLFDGLYRRMDRPKPLFMLMFMFMLTARDETTFLGTESLPREAARDCTRSFKQSANRSKLR